MKTELLILVVASLLSACQAEQASVLDVFPDTGVRAAPGRSSCSYDYTASGSSWVDGVDEQQVFLASIKGDGWQMGVGKGGQIYSLRGLYGESIPPQRPESPWNDEVWQSVITSEELIAPVQDYQNANPRMWNETFPLMYFVHQSGIYNNRVVYKQYAPHIGYQNLLGFLPKDKELTLPAGTERIRVFR